MRTNFSAAQLANPHIAAAERELRSCVHCGICTATCPTYVMLGDELDSPRGRIQLIQSMLESGEAPSAEVVTHIDRCLSCLACVSACPSGVNYPRLIDEARAQIERTYQRPFFDAFIRRALGMVLPRRLLTRVAVFAARSAGPFATVLPASFRSALEAARQLPTQRRRRLARRYAPQGEARRRVALHAGCVQEVMAPGITAAAVRVLGRAGCDVTIVEGSGCCGALNHHLGQTQAFERRAEALVRDIARHEAFDAVVTTTSGCGAVMRDYGTQLQGSAVAEQARAVGSRVRDISDLVLELTPQASMRPDLRVVYHAACSLTHGMRQSAAAPSLLASLGFEVVAPKDQTCCGSAGVYNVLQPKIARALQSRKAEVLGALKPDVIATGNIGCLQQIATAVDVPVVHVIELVDWATGGPVPAALRARLTA